MHRDEREAGADDEARLMLLDLLYGEGEPVEGERGSEERARIEHELREDETLAGELEGWRHVRELMRELPEEEPPDALSTKLLHAAAAEASKLAGRAAARDGAVDGERQSLWARLKDLLMPVVMPVALHPGLAAAASLVLVAGVAGALYVSGRSPGIDMQARSSAPAQAVIADDGAAAGETAMADQKVAEEAPMDRAAGVAEPEADLALAAGADKDEAGPRGGPSRQVQAGLAESKRGAAGKGSGAEGTRSRSAPSRSAKSKADSYPMEDLSKKRAPSADLDDDAFVGGVSGGAVSGEVQNQAPSGRYAEPPTAAPVAQAPPPPPAKPSARPSGATGAGGAVPSASDEEAPSQEAEAPSERRQEKSASRDSQADARTRARSLYRQALAAAGKNDCAAVTRLATQVRGLDAGFYDDVFARDAKLRACMGSKNAVKK